MKILQSAQAVYRRMNRDYKVRKKAAESRVESEYWATKPIWNIHPLFFELDGSRAGKRLAKPPAKNTKCWIGCDAEGRVVIERAYDDSEETFFDWEADPVEILLYRIGGEPINAKLAQLTKGRLAVLAFCAGGGASLHKFTWKGDTLESIDIREAYRSGGAWRLEKYQKIRAKYDDDGQPNRVWIDWAPTEDSPGAQTDLAYKRSSKPVELDLSKDAPAIRKLIESSVERYTQRHQKSAKSHPLACRFDFLYSLGDSISTPWVHASIDTKPDPDGDPSHPSVGKLDRKGWRDAVQVVCDGRKVPVTRSGKTTRCGDSALTEAVGEFLVEQLLEARDDGAFARFPAAARCELGVEEWNGAFGWPLYKDRGKKNLL